MAEVKKSKKNLRRRRRRRKKNIWPAVAVAALIAVIAIAIVIVLVNDKPGSASKENNETKEAAAAASTEERVISITTTETEKITEVSTQETEETVSVTEVSTEQETTTVEPLPDGFYETYAAPHRLPAIYINTEGGQGITSKEQYISGTFAMNANGTEGIKDIPKRSMRIRGRGNTTWLRYDKKSFKINFDEKIDLMGDEKDKDWLLIANYYDRTLTRNNLALQLAKSLSNLRYTCDSYPVDVFMNGEYYGVYDLCEQMEVAGGRIEIEKDETAEDSGFFVEIFGDDPAKNMNIGSLKDVTIKYPKQSTEAQKDYIASYIGKVDSIITSGADLLALEEYVNVDSLIDWMLLMEFTYNWDASFSRNVYMYKAKGGRLEFGPAWDFDFAMGSFGYDDPTYQSWALSTNGLAGTTWATYLYANPDFMLRLKDRWLAVRDNLMQTVDSYLGYMLPLLNDSYESNFIRWMLPVEGVNIQWEWETEYTRRTLPELYEYLQSFFDYRYSFLNNAIIDGYNPPRREQEVFAHW